MKNGSDASARRAYIIRLGPLCMWALAAAACRTPPPVQPLSTVTAPGAGAAEYRTEVPSGEGSIGPAGPGIARALEQASRARGQVIAADPRLAELARWVAQSLAQQVAAPPAPVIDLYARHLGLVEPTPHLLLMLQPDAAALEQHLRDEAKRLMPSQRYTRYGAFSAPHEGGVLAVLVLSVRQLTLLPVKRAIDPGDTLTLQGKLSPGLRAAQLVITYPDGSSERGTPQSTSPFRFKLSARGRGAHRVELLADSADGIQVVANFPIYAGVAPMRELTYAAGGGGPALGADQLSARLLELMNGERARAGRKPLVRDDRLAAIGLAHSQDMELHNFIAHTSPNTGSAVDRVARAGVRTPVVLENIGRGYSADEIHHGLMESPGHRENILNPSASHVGLGVVVTQEDQHSAYLVTEVFARFTPPMDVNEATAELHAGIARERKRRDLPPLQRDAALSERCERAAASFFQPPLPAKEQVIERLNRDAAAGQRSYTQLMAAAVVIGGVDEAIQLEPWFDPKARALAIGLAQGTRADTFENAIIVVALIAY